MRRPKPTFSSAVSQGKSAASAFWKKTTRSRAARVMGTPSRSKAPAEPVSKPARMFSSVVLPQPLAPSRQKNSPSPISRSIPASTCTAAPPRRSRKLLSRRRIASTAPVLLPAELRRHPLGQRLLERAWIEERLRAEIAVGDAGLLHPPGELREIVPDHLVETDDALVVGVVGLYRRGVLDAELLPGELDHLVLVLGGVATALVDRGQ